MTDLSAEQNAMLKRLAEKYFCGHAFEEECTCIPMDGVAFGRELLLAVQEANAKLMECGDPKHHGWRREDCEDCQRADLIRAQSYGELFPPTPKEL